MSESCLLPRTLVIQISTLVYRFRTHGRLQKTVSEPGIGDSKEMSPCTIPFRSSSLAMAQHDLRKGEWLC